MTVARTCTRCKVTRTVDEFGRHTQRPDGLNLWCKPCNREHALNYRNKNIDLVREKDWQRAALLTPEQRRTKHKSWRDRNREHVRAYARRAAAKCYAANPQAFREKSKAWRLQNMSVALEKNRAAHRRRISTLSDDYVRFVLSGGDALLARRLPQSLIEAKREQLKIRRLARELIDE